mmetsp:Transcript_30848/g.86630  ORF Transcript_30848/g.86630 Transcript_30848/m.86630 type:complete len:202 (-) Transcript_30848:201-806(-)
MGQQTLNPRLGLLVQVGHAHAHPGLQARDERHYRRHEPLPVARQSLRPPLVLLAAARGFAREHVHHVCEVRLPRCSQQLLARAEAGVLGKVEVAHPALGDAAELLRAAPHPAVVRASILGHASVRVPNAGCHHDEVVGVRSIGWQRVDGEHLHITVHLRNTGVVDPSPDFLQRASLPLGDVGHCRHHYAPLLPFGIRVLPT